MSVRTMRAESIVEVTSVAGGQAERGGASKPSEGAAAGARPTAGRAGAPAMSLGRRVGLTLEMIKFQHTMFALPFALMSGFLAAEGWPGWKPVFWIVAACVFARSAAMTFNRLHDQEFDRRNPRTKDWPLASGALGRRFAWVFCLVCIAGFVFSAAMLNRLALWLSPVALAVLLGYSVTKRFSAYSHFVLGLALGIAPVGAWVAVRGEALAATPILLGLAVMLWAAGFDIIYSLQDTEFDRGAGLKSLPVKLGGRRALAVSALCHALAVTLFLMVAWIAGLGAFYLGALAVCAWLLAYGQRIVSPTDLSRLGRAFFTVNGWVSVLMFAGALADILAA